VARDADGKAKGNVDVDLTLHALDKIGQYDCAVLVTSDGDFASLVSYLIPITDRFESGGKPGSGN
jgi:uncharacterized LabA/DUF88 family protein